MGPVIGFFRWVCTCPSWSPPSLVGHKFLLWGGPGPSSLVWWVCDLPSHEQLVSTSLQPHPSFHALMHWHSLAHELCVVAWTSPALLLALATALSKYFSISSILDKNSSKISLLSDLVVRWWCTECDGKQSALSFCLCGQYAVSWWVGGTCPDPPWAVSSGIAFPLPLSGGKRSSSNLTSLVLEDCCAPATNSPPTGGGLLVVLWSLTPLFSSSQSC